MRSDRATLSSTQALPSVHAFSEELGVCRGQPKGLSLGRFDPAQLGVLQGLGFALDTGCPESDLEGGAGVPGGEEAGTHFHKGDAQFFLEFPGERDPFRFAIPHLPSWELPEAPVPLARLALGQ